MKSAGSEAQNQGSRISPRRILIVLTGGIVGSALFTVLFSFAPVVQLSMQQAWGFHVKFLGVENIAWRDSILNQVDKLTPQANSLAIQKAALEHGCEGFIVGAGIALLFLISRKKLRQRVCTQSDTHAASEEQHSINTSNTNS